MLLTRVLVLLFIGAAIAISCKNEPYDEVPLGVTTLTDHDSNKSFNYRYHDKRLYTFLSKKNSDTIVFMKFNYSHGILQTIVIDSTRTSKKVDKFYGVGGATVIDSTISYAPTDTSLVATRTITYDGSGNALTVDVKEWTATGVSEHLAELTWEDGNVTRLVVSNVSTGVKVLSRDVGVGYDAENSVYMQGQDYIYTFALRELYWLSKNNPVVFNEGHGDKKYTFSYNRLGYPSNFRTDGNVLFGVAYTQVR